MGRAEAEAEAPPGQDLQNPLLQPSSCGLSGWPLTICWSHYLVVGQQDRVLQVVFYPNDQKPTFLTVKPYNVRLIKICAIMLT